MKVKLNDINYRYHVYGIINIFYQCENIEFVEEHYDMSINIYENEVQCSYGEISERFIFTKDLPHKDFIKKSIFMFLTKYTGKSMPWGTLTGIRPSKIAIELLRKGKNESEIIEFFNHNYCTREDKAKLCIDIGKKEESFINTKKENISVYIGMPFCPTRCLYCSFTANSVKGCGDLVDNYIKALMVEMERMSSFIKRKGLNIQCLYFGGGTPTAVNDEQFRVVMEAIYKNFMEEFNVQEFTVECGRPDSITEDKLETMKKHRVSRISINPQTMSDTTLKLIGRNHSAKDVVEKFYMARNIGFENINMDIIVGLPGEKLEDVINTCKEIKKLAPDSFTVHGLSVKRGSRLHENIVNKENYEIANQKELNEMFGETVNLSKSLSMKPYYMYRQKNMVGNMENIGYALEGKECIYNIQMIEEKQTIIALGADAVSKIVFLEENRLERFANIKDVKEYIERLDEKISSKEELLETLY
ncbi:coproporphyrinogen III oxidase [Haloimpatiens lingqiaonensis]|uniref:coproporphyrinogen III oxidase n=1 Tax=Haloimpatiens lingqiaonensis TaxID=1380675 RepID=UPI0010FD1E43|nr:coproporphyrinogen III oxidase [Haloimpatiens lingqiaonensis]